MRKIFEKPRVINYRSYKHFSNEAYKESLLHELLKEVFVNNDYGLQRFCDISICSINILNTHAPCKRKHARSKQMPFIKKDILKAIMKKSRLCKNFLKNKTDRKIKPYIQNQKNYCVSLLKKSKKKYLANL